MKPTPADQPPMTLCLDPRFKKLMADHLDALRHLALQNGFTVRTFGFAITFEQPGQNLSAYHGCTCLSCAAKTMDILQSGIMDMLQTFSIDGLNDHPTDPQVH